MEYAVRAVRAADKVVNFFIAILIALAMLYAGTALWDTLQIFNNAGDSDLLKYKPEISDNGSNPSLDELLAINPDVRGWLTIDGTNIDYPIVQGENNTEYLNRNVYGEFALSGSIFLDYRNQPDFSDCYSLLYGHHMDGDVMFGEITNFLEDAYFEEHQTGLLYLPEGVYEIRLFACISVDAYDRIVFNPGDMRQERMPELLEHIRKNAAQQRNVTEGEDRKIIGLSTCSSSTTNGRTILYGELSKVAAGDQKGDTGMTYDH